MIDRGIRGRDSGAPRSQLEPDHAGSRVEHDGEVRSAAERQPHLGRALAARAVAAAQPGRSARGHQRRPLGGAFARKTTRIRRSSRTMSSVLGNNKLNSLRVGWTQEDVAFAQPVLQRQRPQSERLRPAARLPDLHRSAGNTPRRASTTRFSSRTRSRGSCRTSAAITTSSSARSTQYVTVDNFAQDNLNGTFSLRHEQRAVRSGQSADLSRSPHDSRPGPGRRRSRRRTTVSFFAQDKWKLGEPPDGHHRRPLRPRGASPFPSATTRSSPTKTTIRSTPTTSSRESACATRSTGRTLGRSRRIRPVLRQDALRDHRRPLQRRRVLGFVHVNFPTSAADPGPRNGQLPTDPFLVNGPVLNRAAAEAALSRRPARCAIPERHADDPTRAFRGPIRCRPGYEHQIGATMSVSADYVHVVQSRDADAGVSTRTTGLARDTASTSRCVGGSEHVGSAVQIDTFLNVGETDYDALLLQVEKRLSQGFSARVSYTLSSADR